MPANSFPRDPRADARLRRFMQLWGAPDDILAGKLSSIVDDISSARPLWVRYPKIFGEFSTAGTTNTIALVTLPAKAMLTGVVIYPLVAFSGGAISAYTLDVIHPVTGSLLASSVFTGSTVAIATVAPVPNMTGTTAMTVTATSTGANLNAALQGTAYIYLLYAILT